MIDYTEEALAASILIFAIVVIAIYGPEFALWVHQQQ